MKKILLLVFLISGIYSLQAQELIVQHSEQGNYLQHKVAPKESFYSIGRLYNVHPKDIAAFNKLDMDKGLNIDQVIRIPLNSSNFSQKSDNGRAVYYVVGESEGLYRVSVKNNNVLMADLRKWNKLSNDNLKQGEKLVVGFLVSAEANNITAAPVPEKPAPPVKETVAEPVKETAANADVVTNPPVHSEGDVERKKELPAVKQAAAPKPAQVNDGSGGYFKPLFEEQVRGKAISVNQAMSAGIFKTSSGWDDKKYYVLIDKVEPGTIIRLVNPSNNKAVYAKVLGEMSGIRQNQGYELRMSNAAASALEVTDEEKFIVNVNY